jgi:hypothetical protein
LYEIDEWRKLYNLNFIDLGKYIRIVGEKYFSHILIIGGALEAPPYKNRDALPESAPFYKKGRLHVNAPFLKRGHFLTIKPPFLKCGTLF